MPSRFQKYIRKRHECAPFSKRPEAREHILKFEAHENGTARLNLKELCDLRAEISRKCRTCRNKTHNKGHDSGCDRSACAWRIYNYNKKNENEPVFGGIKKRSKANAQRDMLPMYGNAASKKVRVKQTRSIIQ
jgi:hypothetical protein